MTGVERIEWHIELLKSAAEERSEDPAEWPERAAPLCPGVEFELRGLFVEGTYSWMDLGRIEGRAGQQVKACEEASGGDAISKRPALASGEIVEEPGTDALRASDWALKPDVLLQRYATTGQLDPLLSRPVAERPK
jgi:hypothetical protein